MTELLAPAGDEKTAYAALRAGADAVYLGLTRFSARESAENFCVSALEKLTREAHLLGAKVYVALNTLVKDGELSDFAAAAREAWNAGADAILMQDVFLGRALKELYPGIVLHLSTQAGCCNVHGARLAKACGFSRVVLARETPLADIPAISAVIETEAFVQGALCTCFRGSAISLRSRETIRATAAGASSPAASSIRSIGRALRRPPMRSPFPTSLWGRTCVNFWRRALPP